ncbi:unnamed protein product, partial [Sphacelaria rigidula]
DGARGGCVTLSDIYEADDDDNVLNKPGQEATGRWLLTTDLYVLDGIILMVWGSESYGDADVLRLESTDANYINLRGYGGSLSFAHTVVTSWDTHAGTVREEYEGGRSYISCVSEILDGEDCEGNAKNDMGECRM